MIIDILINFDLFVITVKRSAEDAGGESEKKKPRLEVCILFISLVSSDISFSYQFYERS